MGKRRRPRESDYVPKSRKQIRAIARELRRRLGIEGRYSPDLLTVLAKITEFYPHFRVQYVLDSDLPDMEAKAYVSAFKLKVRDGIRTGLWYYGDNRARWTIAHELGHLMLGHPGNPPRRRGRNVSSLVESEADWFAAEFLVPPELVDLSMSVDEISRLFQISLEAAATRKRELRYERHL
jgi:hypothetical protein